MRQYLSENSRTLGLTRRDTFVLESFSSPLSSWKLSLRRQDENRLDGLVFLKKDFIFCLKGNEFCFFYSSFVFITMHVKLVDYSTNFCEFFVSRSREL